MRLSQAIGEFLEDLEKVELRALGTCKGYAGDLKAFEAVVIAESANKVVAFTRDNVRIFFRKQSDKGLATETLLRRRSALSEFAKWCIRRKLLVDNPMVEAPHPRRPKRAPRPYSLEERQRLLALELSPLETALRGLLYYAGLRVAEVAALRWKSVRLSSPEQRGALRIIGKGNKERIVPVFRELDAILRTWVVGEGPQRRFLEGGLVLEHRSDALRVRRIEYITAKWGERATVRECVPHRFRHSCATYLFEQGMDVRLIQKILGHESIVTTMGYTQVTDDAMERAISAIEIRQGDMSKIIVIPDPRPVTP